MKLEPIGTVHSPFRQKFTVPRQPNLCPSSQGSIELFKNRVPEGALEDLEGFSHIWVIFGFHKNNQSRVQGKISPPRLNGKKVGVFSSRSPHRPNPIGLSLVKLEGIESKENKIYISGIDIIDQTPVLDIKPYIESYDHPYKPTKGWVQKIQHYKMNVQWSSLARKEAETLGVPAHITKMINEVFSQDARDLETKNKSNKDSVFKTHIDQWDFSFQISEDNVKIISISPYSEIK